VPSSRTGTRGVALRTPDQASADDQIEPDDDDQEPEYAVANPVELGIRLESRGGNRPEKEPWYYAFLGKQGENLKFLAKFLWYLNLVVYGLIAALILLVLATNGLKGFETMTQGSAGFAIGEGILFTLGYFLVAYIQWFSLMSLAAWTSLMVDQARNVRRSRMCHERMANV
jgi:hypothetical protein